MRFKRVITVLLLPWLLVLFLHAQADFIASSTEGCTPGKVKFSIDPSTIDLGTITSVKWHFGFGDTLITDDPDTVTFAVAGSYTIAMIVNNDPANTRIKTDYIEIHRTQIPQFRFEEVDANNYRFIPLDEITDPAATYFFMWRYESIDNASVIATDKTITMANASDATDIATLDTGEYRVTLRIEDTYGCLSSSEQLIIVRPEIELPNIFIPAKHEVLEIDSHDLNTVLSFKVFNRNGLLVFQQEAPFISWDGKTRTGNDLTTGVYFYILESVSGDITGKYNQEGFIHLFSQE